VARLLVTAVVMILLGQTTGALSFVAPCHEHCSAEQDGAASCLPGCPECACCGMARVLPNIALQGKPTDVTVERVWPERVHAIASPAPQDIAHVPKRLLA